MKLVVDFWVKIRNSIVRRAKGWLEWVEMIRYRRMENSRDDWKDKARLRADELREQRKSLARDQEKIQALKAENKRLLDELKKSP